MITIQNIRNRDTHIIYMIRNYIMNKQDTQDFLPGNYNKICILYLMYIMIWWSWYIDIPMSRLDHICISYTYYPYL